MHEIIDDNGVIHSGEENLMEQVFELMTISREEWEGYYPKKDWLVGRNTWMTDWEGDLKLVEVKEVCR